MDCAVHGILQAKNTGVGSLSLLQWICLTQESNQGLLHCRQILCQLSYFLEMNTFSHLLIYLNLSVADLLYYILGVQNSDSVFIHIDK